MTKFKTLDDLPTDLSGKVALVRVDLNLPMKDGSATDVTRVEAAKPTILELCDKGAKVLLHQCLGESRRDMTTGHVLHRHLRRGGSMRDTTIERLHRPPRQGGGRK